MHFQRREQIEELYLYMYEQVVWENHEVTNIL